MKRIAFGLAACLTLGLSGAASAQNLMISGTKLGVELKGHSNVTLSVAGPRRFHMQSFSKENRVALDIGESGAPPDGTYNYEITAASEKTVRSLTRLDDGREQDRGEERVQRTISGTFQVVDGVIVEPKQVDERSDKDSG